MRDFMATFGVCVVVLLINTTVMAHLGTSIRRHQVALLVGGADHTRACERMYLWRDWGIVDQIGIGVGFVFWAGVGLTSGWVGAIYGIGAIVIYKRVHCDFHEGLWSRAKKAVHALTHAPKPVVP